VPGRAGLVVPCDVAVDPLVEPAFVDPTFVEPAFVDPPFVEPTFVDPTFVEPAFVDPPFVELLPVPLPVPAPVDIDTEPLDPGAAQTPPVHSSPGSHVLPVAQRQSTCPSTHSRCVPGAG
jgi:hypothetical protein